MRRAPLTVLLIVSILASGCIGVSRRVETSEENRLQIGFENSEAARLFYLSMLKPKPYMSDQSILFAFPFAIGIEWVLHETEWYNHQVRRADIDQDGQISEQEARVLFRHYEQEQEED